MKKVLIQDKTLSLPALDSIKDLVQADFEGRFEIETVQCLAENNLDITKYSLIISHPHIYQNCCPPQILRADENNIPIILTYKVMTKEVEELRAIWDKFDIPLRRRELGHQFYIDVIKSLEGKI